MSAARRSSRRGGFTLLESTISLGVVAVIGYALSLWIRVGDDTQGTVARVAAQDRELRKVGAQLVDRLRTSSDGRITVTTLADGNHAVTFSEPIDVGGTATWGVHDARLGTGAQQDRADFSLRYTVAVGADGARSLVEQILDEDGEVVVEDELVRGLARGDAVPPGFRVVDAGDVWELRVGTEAGDGSSRGHETIFHVRTRN